VFAEVLRGLGARRALVVHGSDGLDEITTTTVTQVSELHNGKIKTYTISPEDFGFPLAELTDLMINSTEDAGARVRGILDGETGPCRDIAILNAGAAIYAAEKADSIAHGCELAKAAIASGKAKQKLNDLVRLSNQPG
jgi:anthranilate phosphoribosyltransferase